MLPNFFVGGAPTSGTTALYQYLRQHPQVYMSPIKEPTFFAAADMRTRDDFLPAIERDRAALRAYLDGPELRPARYWVTEWDDYVELFRDVRDEIAIGEASASYLWLPSAAPAIRSKLPAARFIFLLRDPADRLFSWYLMTFARDPRVTFREWLLKTNPLPLDGGRYATHLRRFFDNFPREQVRVYVSESLRSDTRRVLRDMFAFLGVDPDQPIDVSRRHNERMVPHFPAIHRLRQRIFGEGSVLGWLPEPARRVLRDLYQRRPGHLTMDPDDRRMVIDSHRDEILRTADLIGRDLSAWLR